ETDFAHSAVASAPAPAAAAAAADRETVDAHRVAPFQHLGVGQPGVGHVGLHASGAVETARIACSALQYAGTRASGYGFVVLVTLVAEGEVVHRSLRSTHHPERAVQRIGDALRGFDVAGDHRRGM